jgi:hypothetical protein
MELERRNQNWSDGHDIGEVKFIPPTVLLRSGPSELLGFQLVPEAQFPSDTCPLISKRMTCSTAVELFLMLD